MGWVSPKTHPHPHPHPHPRGGYEFYTRTRPMTHQTGTHPRPACIPGGHDVAHLIFLWF